MPVSKRKYEAVRRDRDGFRQDYKKEYAKVGQLRAEKRKLEEQLVGTRKHALHLANQLNKTEQDPSPDPHLVAQIQSHVADLEQQLQEARVELAKTRRFLITTGAERDKDGNLITVVIVSEGYRTLAHYYAGYGPGPSADYITDAVEEARQFVQALAATTPDQPYSITVK